MATANRNTEVETHQPSFGRLQIIERLCAKGFSIRKARGAVNALVDVLREGLQQDGEVEFPLGKLKVVPHRHRQQRGMFLGRKRTIYKRRYTVVHELDDVGDKLLNPSKYLNRPSRALVTESWKTLEEVEPARKKITARGRGKAGSAVTAPRDAARLSKKKSLFRTPSRLFRKPLGPLQRSLAWLASLEVAHKPGQSDR